MGAQRRCSFCRGLGHNYTTCPLDPTADEALMRMSRWKRARTRREREGVCVTCGKERDGRAKRCSKCHANTRGKSA